jgi:general secretion pathway protein G
VKRFAIACAWAIVSLILLFLILLGDLFHDAARAKQFAVRGQIAVFQQALEDYRKDVGEYPTEVNGLAAPRVNSGAPNWKGPYLTVDVPVDPWGVPYHYRLVSSRPEITASQPPPDRGKR